MTPFATKLCNIFGCLIAIPSMVVFILMLYLMARSPESAYSGSSEVQAEFKTIHSTLDNADEYQRWSEALWKLSNKTIAVLVLPLDDTIFDKDSKYANWYEINDMEMFRYRIGNIGLSGVGGMALAFKKLTKQYCIININERLFSKYTNPDSRNSTFYHEFSHCILDINDLLSIAITDRTATEANMAAESVLNKFESIFGNDDKWPGHSTDIVKELTIERYWSEVAADLMGAQLLSEAEGIPLEVSVEIFNKESRRIKNLVNGQFLHHTFFYLEQMQTQGQGSIKVSRYDYLNLLNKPHPLGMETLITEMYARQLYSQFGLSVYEELPSDHIKAVKAYIHQ